MAKGQRKSVLDQVKSIKEKEKKMVGKIEGEITRIVIKEFDFKTGIIPDAAMKELQALAEAYKEL